MIQEAAKAEREKELAEAKRTMAEREAREWYLRLPPLPDEADLDLYPPLPDDGEGVEVEEDLASNDEAEGDELGNALERLAL